MCQCCYFIVIWNKKYSISRNNINWWLILTWWFWYYYKNLSRHVLSFFENTVYYISFFNTWQIILLCFIVMSAIINIICSVLVYYHVAVKTFCGFHIRGFWVLMEWEIHKLWISNKICIIRLKTLPYIYSMSLLYIINMNLKLCNY